MEAWAGVVKRLHIYRPRYACIKDKPKRPSWSSSLARRGAMQALYYTTEAQRNRWGAYHWLGTQSDELIYVLHSHAPSRAQCRGPSRDGCPTFIAFPPPCLSNDPTAGTVF